MKWSKREQKLLNKYVSLFEKLPLAYSDLAGGCTQEIEDALLGWGVGPINVMKTEHINHKMLATDHYIMTKPKIIHQL